jgi:MEMO1 family protein
MREARQPAVAGLFYPADATELAAVVDALLASCPKYGGPAAKALIAPHAGYVYSAQVAASAYARLSPDAHLVSRVVLLGPAHRVALRGLALPGVGALATPLGLVEVDVAGVDALASLEQVVTRRDAHEKEHSLEVHLPFLQRLLGSFSVVPLVVGEATPEEVAEVLDRLWGGAETRIIISSDLSHYLPYAVGRSVDESTARSIERRELVAPEQACGAYPMNGLLLAARRRGLRVERLDLRSSGDTSGSRAQVVGYGSFALYEVAS